MSDGRYPITGNQKAKCCNVSSWIKSKIEDEGVQARNIIKYSVPVDNPSPRKRYVTKCNFSRSSSEIVQQIEDPAKDEMITNVISSYRESRSRGSLCSDVDHPSSLHNRTILSVDGFHEGQAISDTCSSSLISTNSRSICSQPYHRHLSSLGKTKTTTTLTHYRQMNRGKPLTESEYKARYWGQMLETLRRTIDEIYSACETDENEVECKEVIMILEHSKQDFFSLIEKMNLLRDYEQTDAQNRPNSLTWDERTTLPGKPIMHQVLASASGVSTQHPYLSLPLSIKSDSSMIEILDSDSDFGGNKSGNWRLLVTQPKLINGKTNDDENSDLCESCTIPSVNRDCGSHELIGLKAVHCKKDLSNVAHIDVFKMRPIEISNLCSLDNEPPDGNDGEDEDEVEGYSQHPLCRASEESTVHLEENQRPNISGYTYLVDDAEYGDHDDNILSHDLEKLDKAIAHFTTAERVLSHQLDKAQLAETALRRRLIDEDKFVFTRSTDYTQSWYYHQDNNNNNNFSNRRNSIDENYEDSKHLLPTCDIDEEVEIDTDIDLLHMDDSVLLDDFNDSEKVITSLKSDCSRVKDKHNQQYTLEEIDHSPLNCVQESFHSQLPSTTTTTTTTATTTTTNTTTTTTTTDYSKKIYPNKLVINASDINHYCCSCHCHSDKFLSVDTKKKNNNRSNNLQDQSKICESVKNSCTKISLSSRSNSSISQFNSKCLQNPIKLNVPMKLKIDHHLETTDYPCQGDYQSEINRNQCFTSTQSTDQNVDEMNIPSKNIYSNSLKSTNTNRVERDSLCNFDPHTSISLSTVSSHETVCPLSIVTSDVNICQQGLLFIPQTEMKSRTPGHGVHMHEKLSARSKRRTANSIQDIEEKQARARVLRQQHLLERTERVHELSKKVDEVHLQKRLLLHQRRSCLERRLHAAERKRQAELKRRVLKAHDEETKGKEIAFIQTLEAEQKQHSILTKHEESRARLHELAIERQKRSEEKLGREEAAKIRRRALEASRRAKLDALQARWETRAQQLASRAELMEHSRRAAARAKEQYREIRMATLEEQQRAHIEQLRSKIQRKQAESERRHQESLREISRKAFEMSVLTHTGDDSLTVPGIEPYPIQKWCKACQVMIVSEVSLKSHLHGKRHQNAIMEAAQNRPVGRSELEAFNLSHLIDAPTELSNPQYNAQQERLKLHKKRTRKLRHKLNQKGLQFLKELEQSKVTLPDSPNKAQLVKLIKDARRFLNQPDSGPWVITRVQAMEKSLNALLRCICNKQVKEQSGQSSLSVISSDRQICTVSGLLSILVNLIGLIREQKPLSTQLVPEKTYKLACRLLETLCYSNEDAYIRMLLSNDVSILVDCLVIKFSVYISNNRYFNCFNSSSVIKEVNTPTTITDQLTNDPLYFHCYSGNSCTLDLLNCLTSLLNGFCQLNFTSDEYDKHIRIDYQRVQDFLSYVVSSGLVDLISTRLSNPKQASWLLSSNNNNNNNNSPGRQNSSTTNPSVEHCQQFVLSSIAFLTSITRLLNIIMSTSEQMKCDQLMKVTGRYHSSKQQTSVWSSQSDCCLSSNNFLVNKVSEGVSIIQQQNHHHHHVDNPMNSTAERCTSTGSSHDNISVNRKTTYETTGNSSIVLDINGQLLRDPTKLLETVNTTEVFGLVPLLYCLLLDPNSRPIEALVTSIDNDSNLIISNTNMLSESANKMKIIPDHHYHHHKKSINRTESSSIINRKFPTDMLIFIDYQESQSFRSIVIAEITLNILKLVNSLFSLHQNIMQSILGSELICLLMRHILVNLLTRCVPQQVNTSHMMPHLCPTSPPVPHHHHLQQQQQHEFNINHYSESIRKGKGNKSDNHQHTDIAAPGVVGDEDGDTDDLLPSGARKVVIKRNPKLKFINGEDSQLVRTNNSSNHFDTVHHEKHFKDFTHGITENILHEAILCMGHLCALNLENQTNLQCGPSPNLLQRLLSLPFEYFSHRPLTDILYPTLIACCYQHIPNTTILESELSSSILANYIEERLLEKQMDTLTKVNNSSNSYNDEFLDKRYSFEKRFSMVEWDSAKAYFSR
ncbi:unnamed protein product [Heterobilharzia americana]|nr:unnamed protein product [Heterobilharzia americana]